MIENSNTMMKVAAGYGLILGFVIIVVQIISYISGLFLLLVAAYIGGIIYSTIVYREKYLAGTISYGKSVLFGVLVSGFTFIIIGIYLYVLVSFNKAEFTQLFNAIIEKMKEQGYTVSDISANMIYNPVFLIISYLITGLFTGLAVSIITSLFTKK
jgi:ABC-type enterobactin transport system permease subunit